MTIKRSSLSVAIAILLALPNLPGTARAEEVASQVATALPLTLKPRIVVEDDVVRLGDLFEGLARNQPEKAEVPVARAPEPGRRIELSARWLAAVASTYDLDWQPRSALDRSSLERASNSISRSEIESSLVRALAARGFDGSISLLFDQPDVTFHVPREAEPTLAVAALSIDPTNGRFVAEIVAPAEGTPAGSLRVAGRAVEMIEVPVPARRLEPGDVITERHLTWTAVRADSLGRNIVRDPRSLLGKSPRRPLHAGEPVRDNELEAPVVVGKNSLVTIRLVRGNLMLTAQGRALDNGADGDLVRVMNTKSNKIINAVVVSAGTVEVPGTIR